MAHNLATTGQIGNVLGVTSARVADLIRALLGFPWVALTTEWRGGTRSCDQRAGWPPKTTGGRVTELLSRLAAGHPQGMALTAA